MREGRIDLALTTPAFAPEGLRSRRLLAERYVGAARIGHPIFDGPVDLARFCASPHLLISPERMDFHGPTDDALAAVGQRRTVALSVPSFSMAPAILAAADLIAVLPERLAASARGLLATFAAPLPIEGFDLVAYWPERMDNDPAHRWFRTVSFAGFADGEAASHTNPG